MKKITVSPSATELHNLLRQAREDSIILRDSSDGAEFILAELDDFEKEVELTRHNDELIDYLEERAKKSGRVTHAEVKKMLGLK